MLLPSFAPVVVAGLVGVLWLMLMAQAYQQGRSRRQLQRLKRAVLNVGPGALAHGNRGRLCHFPRNSLPSAKTAPWESSSKPP